MSDICACSHACGMRVEIAWKGAVGLVQGMLEAMSWSRPVNREVTYTIRSTQGYSMCIRYGGRAGERCFLHPGVFGAAGNKDKKKAALILVIAMLKVYFKLNMLRLAKPAIRSVNSPQFLGLQHFPMSERVTYSYYTGRLAIFDEDYVCHLPLPTRLLDYPARISTRPLSACRQPPRLHPRPPLTELPIVRLLHCHSY